MACATIMPAALSVSVMDNITNFFVTLQNVIGVPLIKTCPQELLHASGFIVYSMSIHPCIINLYPILHHSFGDSIGPIFSVESTYFIRIISAKPRAFLGAACA